MRRFVGSFVGQTFGDLVVIADAERSIHRNLQVIARCICGSKKKFIVRHLILGSTKSCGCRRIKLNRIARTTHGLTGSGAYQSWSGMKTRCTNKNSANFKDYGGRGILMCARWQSFENFYADMGPRPKGMTLDRIDNNGHYSPGNCRWATKSEQNSNTRHCTVITVQGKSMTITQWSRAMNIPRTAIHARLMRGWSAERAVTEPVVGKLL